VRISGVRPQRTNAPSDASKPAKDLLYVGGPFGRQVVSPWREVKVLARRKGEKEKKREKRIEKDRKGQAMKLAVGRMSMAAIVKCGKRGR